jgi:ribosomal protein S7
MVSGNKTTCEAILLKSLKSMQKKSKKNHIDLIHSAITNTTPLLKMNKKTPKKGKRKGKPIEIPSILTNNRIRFSLAIQYIISISRNNNMGTSFDHKLSQEIISNSKYDSNAIALKDNQQIKVLLKKRYLLSSMYSPIKGLKRSNKTLSS